MHETVLNFWRGPSSTLMTFGSSRRCTSRPISNSTQARRRQSSSTWPPSKCSFIMVKFQQRYQKRHIAPAKRFEAVVQIGSGGVVVTGDKLLAGAISQQALDLRKRWRRLLQVGRQRLGDVVATYLQRQAAGFSGNQAPKIGCLNRPTIGGYTYAQDLSAEGLEQTPMSLLVPLLEFNRNGRLRVENLFRWSYY